MYRARCRFLVLGLIALQSACSDGAGRVAPPVFSDTQQATPSALYGQTCSSCHGVAGQGGSGPALNTWSQSEQVLADTISRTMPKNAPGTCTGDCATGIARYILSSLNVTPSAAPTFSPPKRLTI